MVLAYEVKTQCVERSLRPHLDSAEKIAERGHQRLPWARHGPQTGQGRSLCRSAMSSLGAHGSGSQDSSATDLSNIPEPPP